jgi:hypothetical protein
MQKLLLALILVLLPTMALAEVWGSSKSKVYHYRLCRWNAQIRPEYKVSFPSPAAARKAGYQPCGKCRPPANYSHDQHKPAEKMRNDP